MELEQKWQKRFAERARVCREPHDVSHWTRRGFELRLSRISAELSRLCAPDDLVLDLGSGPGWYAGCFKTPVFLDYAAPVFERMDASLRDRSVCGRLQALPFRDETFDGLLCVGVLQCLRLTRADLLGAARVLKPGGWFLFETLNAECEELTDDLNAVGRVRLRHFLESDDPTLCYIHFDDFVVYRSDKLAGWFDQAGLKVREVRHLYSTGPVSRLKEIWRDSGGPDFELRRTTRSFYLFGRKT